MERETILIAPSILAADFGRLAEEVADVVAAGADFVHLDVMDGHFVPNISFGPAVIRALRPVTRAPFDTHLMIAPVDPFLADFKAAGADIVTVHPEAGPHLDRTLQAIRGHGLKAGVALNPATSEEALSYVLDAIDLVLVMSVNPGFGGQSFLNSVLPKIAAVRAMTAGREIAIEVDGGIVPETARLAAEAGANVFVAGSAIFGAGKPLADAVADLRAAAEAGAREAAAL